MKSIISQFAAVVALGGALIGVPDSHSENLASTPARASAEWLRGGVIYEIFPRDFSAAGNFQGVTKQLDQLKALGVTILWTTPIHPIGEKGRKGDFGSPYSIKDYYAVDPHYGTLDDYKRFVSEAHKRGLKVIMDIVANHTAWDSVMMKHPDFYKQDSSGKIIPPVAEWTDVAGLNYNSQALRQYMTEMLEYWLRTCDVDGFRCDVAYMVPTDFWEKVRSDLEKIKPDIMMLAEASKPELLKKAFDLDYSWPMLGALNDVIMKGAPATKLRKSWENSLAEFPRNSLHLRMSDDHDESRAIARYGVNGAMAASAFMFALDGVPLLYNGMEVGDATESGDPALFDKLPVFWAPKDRPQFREIYHGLIELRKKYTAFQNNRLIWLRNSDDADVATFMRLDEKDEFVAMINFSNRPAKGTLEVMNSGDFVPVQIAGAPKVPARDFPTFHLGSFEWRIYHRAVPQ